VTEQCEHQQRNPEGVEWSDNDSLAHFLQCLTEPQQVEVWVRLRRAADTGHMCFKADHSGLIKSQAQYAARQAQAIRVQDEYIGQQVAKLRELEHWLQNQDVEDEYVADAALDKVRGILGLVVSDEEPT
jgi:hypothetical protein